MNPAKILSTPSLIGFDRLIQAATEALESQKSQNYPPFNLIAKSKTEFQVVIALAGFAPDEIEITTEENIITIKGEKKPSEEKVDYLYQGLAVRPFTRKFTLADLIVVRDAKFEHGLLTINFERVVPEAQQKKVIPINGVVTAPAAPAQTEEAAVAAE
jgi:Molecular chaperone (small heat shock protein)